VAALRVFFPRANQGRTGESGDLCRSTYSPAFSGAQFQLRFSRRFVLPISLFRSEPIYMDDPGPDDTAVFSPRPRNVLSPVIFTKKLEMVKPLRRDGDPFTISWLGPLLPPPDAVSSLPPL